MNVPWWGSRQAIRARGLVRGLVGVCGLALCLAGRPAHAQGLLAEAVVPAVADDAGPILEGALQEPALASWGQPIPAEQAVSSINTPVFDGYDVTEGSDNVSDSPPRLTDPPTPFAADRHEGALFGTPVPAPGAGAHLGVPQELAVLDETPPLIPVQYVSPTRRRELDDILPDEGILYTSIQLSLPGPQRLFRLESEAAIRERIRQEARQRRTPDTVEFPEEQRFEPREKIRRPRRWPLTAEMVEPGYVWHRRLLFEQINSERYGWDLGIVQPVLSAGRFYADVLTLPYHVAQDPCHQSDTNAGKCLPGDPVPLLLYPPQGSLTGLGAEAAVLTVLFFALP